MSTAETSHNTTPITLEVGQPAPAWSAEVLTPEGVESASHKGMSGQSYVMYFYPKDDTPGCTKQACDFRDNMARLKAHGYTVFGVSPDSLKRHEGFRDKYELTHSMISDPERTLCEQFGVWREKKNYGKTYLGLVRSTFIVGADGLITHAMYNVKATGHVARVIKLLGLEDAQGEGV